MIEPAKAAAENEAEIGSATKRRGDATTAVHSVGKDAIEILESIDIPVVVVGRDCKILFFNRVAVEALGLNCADIGRSSCQVEALTGLRDIEQKCLQVVADGVPSRLEFRQGDRWFLVRIAPYPDRAVAAHGAVLTFTNVTAFRASMGQALYEREFTKAILNTVSDPLVVLDESLQIQTANRAFYEWFGIARERAQGVALRTLGDEEWRGLSLWAALSAVVSEGSEFETIELERDFSTTGHRTVLLDACRLTRDGRALVLLSFRDISKRKRAEHELRESESRFRELYESAQELYQAAEREIKNRERAEEALRELNGRKDEFLATLAHELRNPLAPIRNASTIAQVATATEEQKRWSHEVIQRQVRQMALLLDDLLEISRVTRGTLELRPQMTDFTSIIAMAAETAQPLIEAKRHVLKIEVPDGAATFAADPLRLAQVLSNLLTNAAKYTDPGGEIRLRGLCDAEAVMFSVTDNGIGIPKDAVEKIFQMFSQVREAQDRSEGGLGIGLALAKGLVELHGGSLQVNSEGLGKGSEFLVKLPRRTLAGRAGEPARTEFRPPIRRRVLIADDNQDAADSLAMLLRMEGHHVAVARDGTQAVAMADSFRPEVALLDIGMPQFSGYEVAQQIRQSPFGQEIILVAITGWGQSSDKARAAAAGFNHHLTKPIEVDALAKVLRPTF